MPKIRQCPVCHHPDWLFPAAIPYQFHCEFCNGDYHANQLEVVGAVAQRTRKISQKQENKNAKDLGGRTTPASGAGKFQKADVRTIDVRLECKYTEKASYVLHKATLDKVTSEAQGDEIPVMSVEFVGPPASAEYYIVSKEWFLELLAAYRKR